MSQHFHRLEVKEVKEEIRLLKIAFGVSYVNYI